MIKLIEVDKIPEKPQPAGDIVDAFLESGKQQVALDVGDDVRPKQQIYNGIYNSIKNRELPVKIVMVEGTIYLQRIPTSLQPTET